MEDPNKIENNILGLLQKSNSLKLLTKLINSGNEEFARVNEFSSIHPISDKQIYYCLKNAAHCYHSFTIKKKSGADREINAPQPGLKQIQKSIKACLDIFLPQSHNSHGFLSGKSIITNSNPHVGRNHVLNMDIENFFPSISYGRLYVVLQMPPLKCSPYVAKSIATLCTLNDCLPQGSPTSPVFTNLICQRLDRKLSYIAAKYNCAQTRYVDDITFSSDSKAALVKAHDKTVKLIEDEGFSEKTSKTRCQSKSIRQEVTGLTVNDFTNSSRKFRRETRAMLHDWTANGLQNASRAHKSDITTDTFKEIVNGRVAFIRSISDTAESRKLLKLLKELKNG
jgi:RNA-directed DNA polymerase